MDRNTIRKELYKNDHQAMFMHVRDGKMYYELCVAGITYQLAMNINDDDMKGADFGREVSAKYLWRWINKGIDSGDFVKLSA